MRKLLTWVVVTVGIAALVRRLRRRHDEERADHGSPTAEPPTTRPPAEPSGDDPADELRRKLAETRDAEPTAEVTLEARRADVHDEGRAALDEMQRSTED